MSSTIYNKGLTVEVSHEFYETANKFRVNRSLDIVPTEKTAALLKRGRMRYVRTEAGLTLFYQAYEDSAPMTPVIKPVIELTGEQEFVFVVRIKEAPEFLLNVTNLNVNSQTYRGGNIFYLDADVNAFPVAPPPPPYLVPLDDRLINQLRPAVFTYSFLPDNAGFNGPVDITFTPDGSVTPTFTFTGVLPNLDTGIYSVQLDFRDEPVGIYDVKAESAGPATQHESNVYIDSALAMQQIFGLIRIRLDDVALLYETCTDPEKFLTFTYEFERREVQWRYYIGIKDPDTYFVPDGKTLKIDTGGTGYSFTPSTGTPTSGFSIVGYDYVVVFTSTTPIPFSETAINEFQLQENDDTVVIPVLANAAYTTPDSNRLDPDNDPPDAAAEIFQFVDSLPQ